MKKKRVACSVRGREDKDRELTIGFYKMMVLNDLCILTGTYNNSINTTLNKHPHSTLAHTLL